MVLYEHKHKLDLVDIVASAQLCSQSFSTLKLPDIVSAAELFLYCILHYLHHVWIMWGW